MGTAEALFNQLIEWLAASHAWQRACLFFGVWLLLWLPLALPLARVIDWRPKQPLTPQQKIVFVTSLYLIALPILWGTTRLPTANWAVYGLAGGRIFFWGGLAGLAIALAGLAIIFAAESGLGWLVWQPQNLPNLFPNALPIFVLALWISWTEEAIFRGVLLTWFATDLGWFAAAFVTSVIFALAHLIWDWQGTLPQIPGLILMGAVLTLARAATAGNLGLAWGLHAGWIWGLTCLDTAALMQYRDRANPWLIGFGGQPLAGLAGWLCLLLTAAVLFGWLHG